MRHVDPPDDSDDQNTAIAAPTRIATAFKGETAAKLNFLAKRQGLFPSGVLRGLIDAAYDHVKALEAQEATAAAREAQRAQDADLKAQRRLLAAETLKRKVAALSEVQTLKGVEIYGSRFKAFVKIRGSGQREQLGVFPTAEEAGLAHDGRLWEIVAENTVKRSPLADDPVPADFNWPLRDDYLTPNEMVVAECRRAYFHSKLADKQYPPRGFLRVGIDDALIAHLDKNGIEIPEGDRPNDEAGRDDRGREAG